MLATAERLSSRHLGRPGPRYDGDVGEKLAKAIHRRRRDMTAMATGSVEETAAWLAPRVRPNDAVLVMGGGRSYLIGRLLLEALTT